jgi:hypothetical protein
MTISPRRTSTALRAIALAVATTALVGSSTLAMADAPGGGQWGQDYGTTHHDWRQGDRIGQNDWNSATPVDYRSHHLRQPPNGYAWRESNGQFVLAAVTTGVIASIVLDSGGR